MDSRQDDLVDVTWQSLPLPLEHGEGTHAYWKIDDI